MSMWQAPPELSEVEQVTFAPGTGLKVLGTPIEHPESTSYRRAYFGKVLDEYEKALYLIQNMGDPQGQHLLIRFCADACRLQYLLRAMDTQVVEDLLLRAERLLRLACEELVGVDLGEAQWLQCHLPMRMGGLGIRNPVAIRDVARLASICSMMALGAELGFPSELLGSPPDTAAILQGVAKWTSSEMDPLKSWVRTGNVADAEPIHCKQRWWSDKVYAAKRLGMLVGLPQRDQGRISKP